MDAANRFVAQTQQHSHPADREGNDSLKARAGIKRSNETQNIITANTAGLPENVLARLPNTETIQRDFRRNRSINHPAVSDIYDTKSATNYTVDVLGHQFLVYDNGQPDRILLFGTDEGFRFLSNSQDWF